MKWSSSGNQNQNQNQNQRKKQRLLVLLLLFFLVSLSFFFLSSSLFFPNNPSIPINNFHLNSHHAPPPFTLTIKLLTYNRLPSLSRCLHSLASAHYDAPVNLHIFLDHFALLHTNSSDRKLKDSHEILKFIDGYRWDFGEKVVHYRTDNAGLQAQWLEAWWPRDDNDFAFVVEDDLQVSPLYYQFIKSLIFNFYYNQSNFSPYIFGATLQRPRFVPGTTPFLLLSTI